MSDTSAMAIDQAQAMSLIDCDVHNYPNSADELMPYLPQAWQAYIQDSGFTSPPGPTYPKAYSMAARRDAWPPSGNIPGSDPEFAREQLLDAHVQSFYFIHVNLLSPVGSSEHYTLLYGASADWLVQSAYG